MAKKWIVGAVMAAIIGILVYGAVLRTSATDETLSANARSNQQGTGLGRGREVENGSTEPIGQAVLDQWVTITGQVSELDAAHLQVTAIDGKIIEMANRSWLYAQPTIKVDVGDTVSLVGFYEGESFEVGKITVEKTGQVVAVRDDYGRPLWGGKGRN